MCPIYHHAFLFKKNTQGEDGTAGRVTYRRAVPVAYVRVGAMARRDNRQEACTRPDEGRDVALGKKPIRQGRAGASREGVLFGHCFFCSTKHVAF